MSPNFSMSKETVPDSDTTAHKTWTELPWWSSV